MNFYNFIQKKNIIHTNKSNLNMIPKEILQWNPTELLPPSESTLNS